MPQAYFVLQSADRRRVLVARKRIYGRFFGQKLVQTTTPLNYAGQWVLPGGTPSRSASTDRLALSEFEEETGVSERELKDDAKRVEGPVSFEGGLFYADYWRLKSGDSELVELTETLVLESIRFELAKQIHTSTINSDVNIGRPADEKPIRRIDDELADVQFVARNTALERMEHWTPIDREATDRLQNQHDERMKRRRRRAGGKEWQDRGWFVQILRRLDGSAAGPSTSTPRTVLDPATDVDRRALNAPGVPPRPERHPPNG